jgi:hypothetical protein
MISIIGRIFESSFLINLFGDKNIAHIFYKLSQTYGTHINVDKYLGTEGVDFSSSLYYAIIVTILSRSLAYTCNGRVGLRNLSIL